MTLGKMTLAKTSAAVALAGLLTAASIAPSSARSWKPWAAAGAGFAAGAIVGSAIVSSGAYYGPGYGAYAYAPGYNAYGYAPGYDAYAYGPGTTVYSTGPRFDWSGQYGHYDSGFKSCATDGQYNRTEYIHC